MLASPHRHMGGTGKPLPSLSYIHYNSFHVVSGWWVVSHHVLGRDWNVSSYWQGALAFWDFAAAAPHLSIDMNPAGGTDMAKVYPPRFSP